MYFYDHFFILNSNDYLIMIAMNRRNRCFKRWDSLLFSQSPWALRFTMETSWHEDTVRPTNQRDHPHPPFPPFLGTPIPISLHVVVLLPNLSSQDLVSSTFICFLYMLSYLAIYFNLRVYSSFLIFSALCCLWSLINSNSLLYSAWEERRAAVSLRLYSIAGSPSMNR